MCTKFGLSTDRSTYQSRLSKIDEDDLLKSAFGLHSFALFIFIFDNLGFTVGGEECGFWQTITQAGILLRSERIDEILKKNNLPDGLASFSDKEVARRNLAPPARGEYWTNAVDIATGYVDDIAFVVEEEEESSPSVLRRELKKQECDQKEFGALLGKEIFDVVKEIRTHGWGNYVTLHESEDANFVIPNNLVLMEDDFGEQSVRLSEEDQDAEDASVVQAGGTTGIYLNEEDEVSTVGATRESASSGSSDSDKSSSARSSVALTPIEGTMYEYNTQETIMRDSVTGIDLAAAEGTDAVIASIARYENALFSILDKKIAGLGNEINASQDAAALSSLHVQLKEVEAAKNILDICGIFVACDGNPCIIIQKYQMDAENRRHNAAAQGPIDAEAEARLKEEDRIKSNVKIVDGYWHQQNSFLKKILARASEFKFLDTIMDSIGAKSLNKKIYMLTCGTIQQTERFVVSLFRGLLRAFVVTYLMKIKTDKSSNDNNDGDGGGDDEGEYMDVSAFIDWMYDRAALEPKVGVLVGLMQDILVFRAARAAIQTRDMKLSMTCMRYMLNCFATTNATTYVDLTIGSIDLAERATPLMKELFAQCIISVPGRSAKDTLHTLDLYCEEVNLSIRHVLGHRKTKGLKEGTNYNQVILRLAEIHKARRVGDGSNTASTGSRTRYYEDMDNGKLKNMRKTQVVTYKFAMKLLSGNTNDNKSMNMPSDYYQRKHQEGEFRTLDFLRKRFNEKTSEGNHNAECYGTKRNKSTFSHLLITQGSAYALNLKILMNSCKVKDITDLKLFITKECIAYEIFTMRSAYSWDAATRRQTNATESAEIRAIERCLFSANILNLDLKQLQSKKKPFLIDILCEARKCISHFNIRFPLATMQLVTEKSAEHLPQIVFNEDGYEKTDFEARNKHVIFICDGSLKDVHNTLLSDLGELSVASKKRKARVEEEGTLVVLQAETQEKYDAVFKTK